jgi:hypothetical protein
LLSGPSPDHEEARVGSAYGDRRDESHGSVLRFGIAAALTAALIAVLIATGGLQTLDDAFGKRGPDKAASAQYQYRPGWGCGDRNHIHTGPPGRQYAEPPPGCFK